MRVAITGVSGSLGKCLAKALEADPQVDAILGLDIVPPGFSISKLHFQYADVRTADFRTLLQNVDALFHLAFVVDPPRDMPMEEIDSINVDGSLRVFEGAFAAGVPKIVFSSSVAVYGAHPDNPELFGEDAMLRPNQDWYYSRAKGRVEGFLETLQDRHPEAILIRFRPCTLIGPSVRTFLGNEHSQRFLLCFDRQMRLDLCWEEDVAEAFRLGLYQEHSGTYNLSADHPVSFEDISRILGKRLFCLKRKWMLPVLRTGFRLGLLTPWMNQGDLEWLDVGTNGPILVSSIRVRESLGWKPQYDCTQAMVRWAKETQ